MSASLGLAHPAMVPDDFRGQPGFWNDDNAYAAFLAEIDEDGEPSAWFRDLDLDPLLAVTTHGRTDEEVAWTSPTALEAAARRLEELVISGDPRVSPIVRIYDLGANHVDDVEVELARDLRDLAALARWGRARGWERVALEVNW